MRAIIKVHKRGQKFHPHMWAIYRLLTNINSFYPEGPLVFLAGSSHCFLGFPCCVRRFYMWSCPPWFFVSELRVVPRFFVHPLMVVKYFLWRVRNDYHFRDDPPGFSPAFVIFGSLCHLCWLYWVSFCLSEYVFGFSLVAFTGCTRFLIA